MSGLERVGFGFGRLETTSRRSGVLNLEWRVSLIEMTCHSLVAAVVCQVPSNEVQLGAIQDAVK